MNVNLGKLGGQLGVGLCLLGFLVLFFGWNGAASHDYVPAQFPFLISGGAVGLGIVVVGAALVVVQNQRADRARIEAVLERLAGAVERQWAGSSANGSAAIGGYVVAGAASYHRVDCSLPEPREDAHLVPLEDIRGTELEPCRVCQPPQFGRLMPQP